eukprot:4745901-Amphidinium_carterae.1
MASLQFLVIDFSNAVARGDVGSWVWVPLDIIVFMVMCIATRYRDIRGTLYVDFFFIAIFLCGGLTFFDASMQQGSDDESDYSAEHYMSCLYSPLLYPLLIVFTTFAGLHSSVVPFIFTACVITVLRSGNMVDGLPTILFTTAVAFGSMSFEFAAAYLFRELHTELECNQRLLDGATD